MIITSPENSNDFLVSSTHDRFHSSDHTFLYRMRLFPQRLCSGCVYFCGGTSPVRQKYSQTQTYIKQINSEISAKVGIEIPLPIWIKIVADSKQSMGLSKVRSIVELSNMKWELNRVQKSYMLLPGKKYGIWALPN